MKTVEQLKKEQEAALLKLTREVAIADSLPVKPDSVKDFSPRAPWVSYKRETIGEALEVFKAFQVVQMAHTQGTFTHLCPKSEITSERGEVDHKGDYCAAIAVDQGEGFGPNVTLYFYAQTDMGLVRVNVELQDKQFNRNKNIRWRAEAVTQIGHTGRVVSRKFNPNRVLYGMSDGRISYASGDMGPIKTSARIVYTWVSDDVNCTEFSHFCTQVESLGEQLG